MFAACVQNGSVNFHEFRRFLREQEAIMFAEIATFDPVDGFRKIDKAQWTKVMRQLGLPLNDAQVLATFSAFDTDGVRQDSLDVYTAHDQPVCLGRRRAWLTHS